MPGASVPAFFSLEERASNRANNVLEITPQKVQDTKRKKKVLVNTIETDGIMESATSFEEDHQAQ